MAERLYQTCDIYNPAKKITVVLNLFLQQHTQITENQDKMSVDIFFKILLAFFPFSQSYFEHVCLLTLGQSTKSKYKKVLGVFSTYITNT